MPSTFQIIDREISYKRKCYIICTDYDAADCLTRLSTLCDTAFNRGAETVYFACKDIVHAAFKERIFSAPEHTFKFYCDFFIMTKILPDMSTFQGSLRIKPLRKSNALLYEALFNESFYSVPNALTMDTQQLQHIQNDSSCSAGFLMEGGMPIGVFELQYDDPIPEIAALAINVDLQGQGYGRRALATLEQRLRSEGFSCAKLLVSSLNQRAIRLYCSAGYLQNQHLSRWYQTACMSL